MRQVFISYYLMKIVTIHFALCLSFAVSSQINRGFLTLKPVVSTGPVYCLGSPTTVVDVLNPTTGKIWMDRNLGASRASTFYTDALSYGDLYQWGRFSDGHQCRTSSITLTNSATDSPGHTMFIRESSAPYDWRIPQNDNLWQGVSGVNNPCPTGYRLPTSAELEAERVSWGSNDACGAFGSPLKLPLASGRDNGTGSLYAANTFGFYWTSTVSASNAQGLTFTTIGANMNSYYRALGYSVRCIKE